MWDRKMFGRGLHWLPRLSCQTTLFSLLVFFAWAAAIHAQTASPAATESTEKTPQGFTPGFGFGTKFEGSTSSDGTNPDLTTGFGYNFSRHFGVVLGVPYYFVVAPSSIQQNNPGGLSEYAVRFNMGDSRADLTWILPGHALTYASTIHAGAPTGDKKNGFSVGHVTWNWSNHFEHGWGNFSPFVDGGVGNTIPDTRFFHRPYMTFGYNASAEAGIEFDAGPLSLTGSAYDIAPWRPQTVISRIFSSVPGSPFVASGASTDRRGYASTSVQTGGASLTRDNGFNAGVEVKPRRYLDLEFGYSRSVPLHLNNFSFGIGVNLGAWRPAAQ